VRTFRRLLLGALAGIVLLSIIGSFYETSARRRDARRLPPIGRQVDIGGRRLLLNCMGTGRPTVVLLSGAGSSGYSWVPIQRQLAPIAETCWVDRAGEGWSDPGPYPLTSSADARDLHAALHRAGVAPPYLLVGHSLGGLNARVFAGAYPKEDGRELQQPGRGGADQLRGSPRGDPGRRHPADCANPRPG
jgi:pimeloyl-ACP methyl ester carboxylesterase